MSYPVFTRWMNLYKKATMTDKSDDPVLKLDYLDVDFPEQSDEFDFLRAFSTPNLTHLSLGIHISRVESAIPIVGFLAYSFPQLKELVLYGHKVENVVRT